MVSVRCIRRGKHRNLGWSTLKVAHTNSIAIGFLKSSFTLHHAVHHLFEHPPNSREVQRYPSSSQTMFRYTTRVAEPLGRETDASRGPIIHNDGGHPTDSSNINTWLRLISINQWIGYVILSAVKGNEKRENNIPWRTAEPPRLLLPCQQRYELERTTTPSPLSSSSQSRR